MDYRAFNKVRVNKYTILQLKELLDELYGVVVVLKIDIKLGYHLIWFKLVHVHKIVFVRTQEDVVFVLNIQG